MLAHASRRPQRRETGTCDQDLAPPRAAASFEQYCYLRLPSSTQVEALGASLTSTRHQATQAEAAPPAAATPAFEPASGRGAQALPLRAEAPEHDTHGGSAAAAPDALRIQNAQVRLLPCFCALLRAGRPLGPHNMDTLFQALLQNDRTYGTMIFRRCWRNKAPLQQS